jgi:hypothetical protein
LVGTTLPVDNSESDGSWQCRLAIPDGWCELEADLLAEKMAELKGVKAAACGLLPVS